MSQLWSIITASDPAVRNRSLDAVCRASSLEQLLAEVADLERRRQGCENLYQRVRALFFLYAMHRFHLPKWVGASGCRHIPYAGFDKLLKRRYEEAIGVFLAAKNAEGLSDGLCSALAAAYRGLAFQTLSDQVRRSVRSVRGNQWMFRCGHPADYALRIRPELLQRNAAEPFPLLHEQTPVRMDLSHTGWSDIFFLGMDMPDAARVLNVSIDLALHRQADGVGQLLPKPPVEA